MADERFIPPHGGYEKLFSFQKARIVYDGTVLFCKRFLKRGDRTIDQMVQAARSGKQNIQEGSEASGTSKESGNLGISTRYELSGIGVLLTKDGQRYKQWLVRYLEYSRDLFISNPEQLQVSNKDLAAALNFHTDEGERFFKIVTLARLTAGSSHGSDEWSITVPPEIEDLPRKGRLNGSLESLLFRG